MSTSGPMYMRIAAAVRESVARGQYLPGQMLPPERAYMETFAVSRVTVRRALKELVDEALIESRQGSGYVVQSSRLYQPLEHVTSFSEDCRSRGLVPGSVLLGRRSGRSDEEESAHFGVPIGTEVLRVRRVRTGDGEPLLLEHATLLAERAPPWPWPEGSLYRAMERAGYLPTRVRQRYLPVLADAAIARRLDVEPGEPLMLVVRGGFSADDEPVEYSRCWFRADRWDFSHEIYRRAVPS